MCTHTESTSLEERVDSYQVEDYAISIWSPYKQKYKDAIKNVQRRATKQLPGMKNILYEERLQRLKLPTLAYTMSMI